MDENGDCSKQPDESMDYMYMLPESIKHGTCVILHAELNGDSVAHNFFM